MNLMSIASKVMGILLITTLTVPLVQLTRADASERGRPAAVGFLAAPEIQVDRVLIVPAGSAPDVAGEKMPSR